MTWNTSIPCGSITLTESDMVATSTASTGSWSNRCYTTSELSEYTFTLDGNPSGKDIFVGLSTTPTTGCGQSADLQNYYGLYVTTSDNKWRLYEDGTKLVDGTGFAADDEITFKKTGSVLTLLVNDVLYYTFGDAIVGTYYLTFTVTQSGGICTLTGAPPPPPSSGGVLLPPPIAMVRI